MEGAFGWLSCAFNPDLKGCQKQSCAEIKKVLYLVQVPHHVASCHPTTPKNNAAGGPERRRKKNSNTFYITYDDGVQ